MKTTDLIDAVLRLGVHAMGTHVTPVDTDALKDALEAAADWSDVNENLLDALKAQGHYEMKQGDYPSICGVCSRFYKPAKWPCPAAQALNKAEGAQP